MSDAAQQKNNASLLSTLGLAAAVAAFVGASCCVLPLVLAWVGLAGAWIANLEIFVVYRAYITVLALVVIAVGWWISLRRHSSRGTLIVLGCATVLVLGAFLLTAYEGQITRYVLSLRRR
jgi:mercuric ion transport protein